MKQLVRNTLRLLSHGLLFAALPAAWAQHATAATDYVQLTNLPTLYVDTEDGASVKSKETYVKCTVRYVDSEGITLYDAANIRGRGNSTWNLAKKPYRLKFDKKQRFLGADRAKAKSWTLLANYADKSLIRNAIASYIGTFAGQPFTPAAQFADLVLNGEYLGNYQISDQIDIRSKRVEITEQPDSLADDADITGGYLLEVDGFASSEPSWFETKQGVYVTIKSPDDEVIAGRQYDYIRDFVQQFEDALYSSDFADPQKGYRQYVDSLTLASWYISSELTANPDCFWSTYMYKEQGIDKIFWGPLWDYDIAFNNCTRIGDTSNMLMVENGFGAKHAKKWAKLFWQDPWFLQLINRQWQQMVTDGVEERVIAFVDSIAAELEQSQQLNYQKWAINKRAYNELVLFDTYAEGIEYIKDFIHTHCSYLTDVLAEAAGSDNSSSSSTTDPSVEPETPSGSDDGFTPNRAYLYHIQNVGSKLCADVDDYGEFVELNSLNDDSYTQQWAFEPSDESGYYHIVSGANGLAMTDDAEWYRDAYSTGSQVCLTELNRSDRKQQWKFVQVKSENRYVVVNRETDLAWNNHGGYTTDGTELISWTNDSQNENKPTRQWTFSLTGVREQSDMTDALNSPAYRVTYTPDDATLHFRTADNGIFVGGVVNIYTASGRQAVSTAIAADIPVTHLAPGIYVVSWHAPGIKGTTKFTK